jgi:uridine kinase
MKKGILIGICGASGSGKTMLAKSVLKQVDSKQVVLIQEDSYYKDLKDIPLHQRGIRNFDHAEAFDHRLLIEQVSDLLAGRSINHPVYDYKTHTRTAETRTVDPHDIVILEGILVMHVKELRDMMDIKVYIDVPADICFIRRLQRDISERGREVQSVIDQYLHTVRPGYYRYVEPSRQYADIIVPLGGENEVAVGMLAARIEVLLMERVKGKG